MSVNSAQSSTIQLTTNNANHTKLLLQQPLNTVKYMNI